MRKLTTIGGALAALAVFAAGALPAAADQFTASKTGKSAGRGYEEVEIPARPEQPEFEPERMQEFRFGKFRVLCYRARGKGEVTQLTSETFQTTTKYSNCGWYPNSTRVHVSARFNRNGLTVVYHANGWVELLGDGEGESYEYKNLGERENAAEIKISSSKACTIAIPEQTIPARPAEKSPEETYAAVTYTNEAVPTERLKTFPTGFQEKVRFSNEWKNVRFKYIGEETQCANLEEFEKQSEEEGGGSGGSYKGSLLEEVVGGNLMWEPTTVSTS